jgi:bromodomain and WD repeat domain-containing protein 1/3
VKWSPRNGELFASTDSHGHLSVFGFGASTPESYSSTPSQLFFHTDYDPLCESNTNNNKTLVDKRTKIAPNLMPYGYLIDYMRNPMPLSIQRLVPTHESLTKEEFEKLIVPKPNGADGQFVINDRLTEINFASDNLNHKNLIQPLSESLLRF